MSKTKRSTPTKSKQSIDETRRHRKKKEPRLEEELKEWECTCEECECERSNK